MTPRECSEYNKPLLKNLYNNDPSKLRWTFKSYVKDFIPNYEEVMCSSGSNYLTIRFYENGARAFGEILSKEQIAYQVLRMIQEAEME